MIKLRIKIIGIILIMICTLHSIVLASSSTTSLKNEQAENNKKINEAQSELKDIQVEKSDTIKQVDELTSQITEYQKQISEIDSKIEELDNKTQTSQKEIEEAQKNYEKKEELLKARLVAVYESGETSYLDVLLGSESLIDLISNYYLVSEIVISDEELLEEIQKQKENIENSKHDLEVSQEEMNTSKEQKQNVSEELQKSKTEKNTYVAKLSNDEKEIQEQIEDLNQANKSIDDKITAIIASSNNTSSNNNSNNGNINVNVNGSSSAGFIKPVNSYVTTGMYYSSGQYHGAVDYGAAGINGLPVYAVGDGEVILAEALTTSYGNYIIIKHDNGLFTLYAHGQAGSIAVSKGQRVSKGQQIMRVGNTGNSTGPHLHFEVRQYPGLYNNRVAPLDYIPR